MSGAGRDASSPRTVLAIEVSQRGGGVAVARMSAGPERGDTEPIDVVEETVGPPDHDRDRLMPAIDAAFSKLGAGPESLAAIVVSIGPGGFTGLRMAVATAKAIALVTECRIVALPSAVVAASTWMHDRDRSEPIDRVDRIDRIDRMEHEGSTGSGKSQEVLVALASKGVDAWISRVRVDRRHCDEIDARIAGEHELERIIEAMPRGRRVILADEHLPVPLAEAAMRHGVERVPLRLSVRACLREGHLRIARGEWTSADDIAPLYPREPEAVRLWRERHGVVADTPVAPPRIG